MTALLLLILRIVILLLVLRLLARFVAAVVRGYRQAAAPPGREVKELDMGRDRVCDTFVPRSRALVAWVDGKEQHFCSPRCRDRAQSSAP